MDRRIRRLFAKTIFHRAWLSGRNGYFIQNGVQYGLCNPYGADQDQPLEGPFDAYDAGPYE